MKIAFLGDSHGIIPDKQCFPDCPVFHVGDLGVGFGIDRNSILPDNLRFIRGNHDDPAECSVMSQYLGDFGFIPDLSLAYIGGAESKDRSSRIQGKDWWENEELSYSQFSDVLVMIEKEKPKIILSHDAPSFLFSFEGSVTRKNLEYLFNHVHKPEYWIFGHHHYSRQETILDTKFISLEINEFYLLDDYYLVEDII